MKKFKKLTFWRGIWYNFSCQIMSKRREKGGF
ncbi:hypothetical protein CDSM653_00469 [Caldanaerobacter subterraneus subsp. pacificus DSM 12653]|uniref:Uncharacterized protein n=1 Tax=Caldanaerobacter subterraneus subsp. pacificus DSM 12653 TaxID=391606 RepID=A0A0F5PPC5_9THEO|nr:hypothetical protein CDSM653_00469 [Caldanaerobacter subterraneus subsp. pacificus DSM 12653]